MKCFTSYARFNPDTIQGERLVVTYNYSTFDTEEMDSFEEAIRNTIGSGIRTEFEFKEQGDANEVDKGRG